MYYVSVDPDGFIRGTHEVVSASDVQLQQPGNLVMIAVPQSFVVGGSVDSATLWMPDHTGIEPRPRLHPNDEVNLIANDQDMLVIEDIPEGTIYYHRRGDNMEFVEDGVIDDGVFEFTSAETNTYYFEFVPPKGSPYQRQTIKVMTHD